jgi:GH15 family glucan-1,4-alpha-glucosidase
MRTSDSFPGNTWYICSLWVADFHIASARSRKGLEPALAILDWVAATALPSGVLAEQLDPQTGEPVSVSPLTWSHSTFVATVANYLRKDRMLTDRRK